MRKTAGVWLRCLAILGLSVVLIVGLIPAALGHLIEGLSLPVAEWAKRRIAAHLAALKAD